MAKPARPILARTARSSCQMAVVKSVMIIRLFQKMAKAACKSSVARASELQKKVNVKNAATILKPRMINEAVSSWSVTGDQRSQGMDSVFCVRNIWKFHRTEKDANK